MIYSDLDLKKTQPLFHGESCVILSVRWVGDCGDAVIRLHTSGSGVGDVISIVDGGELMKSSDQQLTVM